MSDEPPQKAEQIELDPEDDEILDAVWDKIAVEDDAIGESDEPEDDEENTTA